MGKLAAFLLTALLAAYGFHALAQSRIDVRPAVTPMGTSSSNGVSFAWFFDANSRTVHVCRAPPGANTPLDCRTATALP
jgi:hypothetical protein